MELLKGPFTRNPLADDCAAFPRAASVFIVALVEPTSGRRLDPPGAHDQYSWPVCEILERNRMALSILGIGTAVPSDCVSQEKSLQVAKKLVGNNTELADMLGRLYPATRIAQRHSAIDPKWATAILSNGPASSRVIDKLCEGGGPSTAIRLKLIEEAAGELAEEAACRALSESGYSPDDVTHLITVSSTVGTSPGLDIELIQRLGLRDSVARTNVGMMMCQASLNGLRVANSFATADRSAVILMVVLEICSVHYDLDPQPKKLVSNAIFGDGAAALVGTSSISTDWSVERSGGFLLRSARDGLRVAFGDHGLDIQLSTRVPGIIEQHLRQLVDDWLDEVGLAANDIQSWAVHPGGPKILEAAAAALDLQDDLLAASWDILERYGNMSSPTVLFILEKLRRDNAPLPCVAIGFGPGMTVEMALIRPR